MKTLIILGAILEVLRGFREKDLADFQDPTDLRRKAANTKRRIAQLRSQPNDKHHLSDITLALNTHVKECSGIRDIVKNRRHSKRGRERDAKEKEHDLYKDSHISSRRRARRGSQSPRDTEYDQEEESEASSEYSREKGLPEGKEKTRFYYKPKRAFRDSFEDEEFVSTEDSAESKE